MTISLDGFFAVVLALPTLLLFGAMIVGAVVLNRRGFFKKGPPGDTADRPLARAAASRGWSYRPSASPWLLGVTAPPFGMGDGQRVADVIVGSRPAGPFLAFRLELITRSEDGSDERVRAWRIASIPLAGTTPQIVMTPDGALAAFLGAEVLERGEQEIEVESHAFNERWRVGTDDPGYAHAVLSPAAIAALVDVPRDVACITIEDGNLLAASPVPVLEIGWIDTTLNSLEAVRAGIPPFVFKRWAVRPTGADRRAWRP